MRVSASDHADLVQKIQNKEAGYESAVKQLEEETKRIEEEMKKIVAQCSK